MDDDYPIKKEFEPGHGYTREDWDAVDFPEMTADELKNMRPAKEVLPPKFFEAIQLNLVRRARDKRTSAKDCKSQKSVVEC
jgi:uncharacterized protein (DUF4415 family)